MRPYPLSKVKKAALAAALVVASCLTALDAVGALSVSAQPNNGASLAQEYLAALKPAGAAISTAEAKLQHLPVTASVAQVKAIVAPLHKAFAPLDAITLAPTTTPTGGGASLEVLTPPTFRQYNCNCTGKVEHLFNALIGKTIYNHGLQLVTTRGGGANFQSAWASYHWVVGGKYTRFSAGIASGTGNACSSTLVRIQISCYTSQIAERFSAP